jgi:C-terminal processing protease CtpA/Prc
MRTRNFLFIFLAFIISLPFIQCKKENKEKDKREDYDNSYYIGEFNENGKRHGQGTCYWNSGAKYEGQWENGNRHGQGKMIYDSGDIYDGAWKNDLRHGQGTYYWNSGAKYEGQWENGSRHGQGKMTYDYGDIYDGTWKESKRNGQGKTTYPDGSTFTCEWKDDVPTDEKCYLLWHLKGLYFWKDEIGRIDANNYTSAEDLLAKKRYAQDAISSIEDIATGKTTLFFAGKEIGYGFGMRWDANDNLRVAYVHANSPGGVNGLKRGWKITHINGSDVKTMTSVPSNIEEREGISRSFTVEDENGNSKTVSLTASIYTLQTVLYNRVIKHKQKTIGYLALKSFIDQIPNALLSAASALSGSGINELVLDLRYCSGGSYTVLNDFVNLIAPHSLNNRVYLKANYNNDNASSNTEYTISKTGSLNLNRIFVITSAATTNVPEYLINGLSPYMNLVIIGDKTRGSGYTESYWTFGQKRHYLVTRIISNAQNGNTLNGILPNYSANDGVDKPWADENEDCMNAVLSYIDNGYFPKSLKRTSPAMQHKNITESVNPVEVLIAPKEMINTEKIK